MNRIYAVGIGPGEERQLTIEAKEVLGRCSVVIGYTVYTDLIRTIFPDKKFISTPMKQEVARCEIAIEEAQKHGEVAMVCSGDAGVYGMASLLYEIGKNHSQVEIIVIPGITAAISGGAVLGAPLNHDFAVISLSDLLTPWETIERRIKAAAKGDFVICLYNPSSRKRHDYLKRACEYILEYKSPDIICGFVRNIGRRGEAKKLLTLKELADTEVDMFTTVYIGNNQTQDINGSMVTPRGYKNV
ncbi:precorrin-3B C17-methyltransferase [Aequitasia blattaphilus]|uniref:Precorrin-3B C(17)-methyltransferase n=1 Tax=Aequitasia blattaphilus TaxID=2949332 RepID=A0ABT1ECG8_9FIRM|nr:precorrin-3B C(17)-methyltransferase [Aequitasia blattaphilus]MCP1102172.1 precorrin-3B C(17)-methyltransferase [Aequitasia blattaphilus]MCR8614812.1 precorrin-3B C(17)-methyltransferase [Aequitasia blattaphilus]